MTTPINSDLKLIVLHDPQILLDALSERINALQAINDSYPRYMGSLYSASKEVEDDIEKLLDELDAGIAMLQDPDVWSKFDDDAQEALDGWVKMTNDALQANREEVKKAREFLAKYGQ